MNDYNSLSIFPSYSEFPFAVSKCA